MLLEHLGRLLRVDVRMLALAHAIVAEHEVAVGRDPCLGETGLHAGEHAAVEREYPAAAPGSAHETRDATADTRDAGHLGETRAIEPDRELIGHLRGARAAGTGVDEGQLRVFHA